MTIIKTVKSEAWIQTPKHGACIKRTKAVLVIDGNKVTVK